MRAPICWFGLLAVPGWAQYATWAFDGGSTCVNLVYEDRRPRSEALSLARQAGAVNLQPAAEHEVGSLAAWSGPG
jgi:hypothetical protein